MIEKTARSHGLGNQLTVQLTELSRIVPPPYLGGYAKRDWTPRKATFTMRTCLSLESLGAPDGK